LRKQLSITEHFGVAPICKPHGRDHGRLCSERSHEESANLAGTGIVHDALKRDFLAFNEAINGAFAPNLTLQGALKAAGQVKRA